MASSTDPGPSKEHAVSHAQAQSLDPIEPISGSPWPELDAELIRDQAAPSISRTLKGKEREWSVVDRQKTGKLYLLDLPVDILRLIVKELTYTNDLTALALTCSTLYGLSIPHIYARFDIVWPDINQAVQDSKSVDALTYGLSTLCLGSKFAQRTRWLRGGRADRERNGSSRVIDNQYAKYVRKFSLGNGPQDWVSDYAITKESGKMLGTLVALAVEKMVNLESFVWDMPTGVLSDVFMALASLQDHYPDGYHKLDKVWVRWHDNWETNSSPSTPSSPIIPPAMPTAVSIHMTYPAGTQLPMTATPVHPPKFSDSTVEYPTFSILPPLKALSVLDIDDLAYLDEMSVLIERSKDTLQELRVGISQKASAQDFVGTWEGTNLRQVDLNAQWPGESTIGDKRLGGVLGVLVGRVYEIRPRGRSKPKADFSSGAATPTTEASSTNATGQNVPATATTMSSQASTSVDPGSASQNIQKSAAAPDAARNAGGLPGISKKKRLDGKLRLRTLELERISLSMQVCCKAFDWSVLTSLTILDCPQHERLWKVLKNHFQPTSPPQGSPPGTKPQYHLALKAIHTDATTQALMNFLKDTLEPNSLETLFLQDRRRATQPVITVDYIFRVVVKRHRASLKKLLIDSNDKMNRGSSRTESLRWKHWVLSSEMVLYLTSGRMKNLRELAVALHYKDWHMFLQRLPNIPDLRCLYVPHVQDFPPASSISITKELAMQIIDIITLRPEVRLMYAAIGNKCFEIIELPTVTSGNTDFTIDGVNHHFHPNTGAISVVDADETSSATSDTDDDEGHASDEGGPNTDADGADDADGSFTEGSNDSENDEEEVYEDDLDAELEQTRSTTRLRLREILFYDDKVAIFRARLGKL